MYIYVYILIAVCGERRADHDGGAVAVCMLLSTCLYKHMNSTRTSINGAIFPRFQDSVELHITKHKMRNTKYKTRKEKKKTKREKGQDPKHQARAVAGMGLPAVLLLFAAQATTPGEVGP